MAHFQRTSVLCPLVPSHLQSALLQNVTSRTSFATPQAPKFATPTGRDSSLVSTDDDSQRALGQNLDDQTERQRHQ